MQYAGRRDAGAGHGRHWMRLCDGRWGTDVRPGVNLGVTGASEPRDGHLKLWMEKRNRRSRGKNQTVVFSIQR